MNSNSQGGRIAGKFQRGAALTFSFDGKAVEAFEGETVAAALIAAGLRATRSSPSGMPRGPLCLIGSCQECAVRIDGRKVLACMTEVTAGLVVQADRIHP
ncbi:MAG: (2Fe-2S)-binding protein [Burkholderiales bacterium]